MLLLLYKEKFPLNLLRLKINGKRLIRFVRASGLAAFLGEQFGARRFLVLRGLEAKQVLEDLGVHLNQVPQLVVELHWLLHRLNLLF